jgi:alkaline phosphatase
VNIRREYWRFAECQWKFFLQQTFRFLLPIVNGLSFAFDAWLTMIPGMKRFSFVWLAFGGALFAQNSAVIFNVDGASLTHWTAARLLAVGPDGLLNWDRLPAMAEHRTHSKDRLVVGTNPLNTALAYGVKVGLGSYGTDGDKPLVALSGKPLSIMEEARAAGKSIGLVNTADLTEGGTGAYLGKFGYPGSPEVYTPEMIHRQRCAVALQLIEAKPDVMLGGGERYFLSTERSGEYATSGLCPKRAPTPAWLESLGFRIAYDKARMTELALEPGGPVLGLFAAMAMRGEEGFDPSRAPTLAEMVDAALRILSRNPNGFLLVINEEGVDDYSNVLDAPNAFAALQHADQAIGVISEFIGKHPDTLLVVTADSPAGGLTLLNRLSNSKSSIEEGKPLPARDPDGAPLQGASGAGTVPFVSKPDEAGRRHVFAVAWGTRSDVAGGVIARAMGKNSDLVRGSLDNPRLYRVIYQTLFGRRP